MAPEGELLARRKHLRDREKRVERQIAKREQRVEDIGRELVQEADERKRLRERRKDLAEQLETEIKRDEKDRGKHGEHWEDWVETRRDELADLYEASEARSDRLIERAAEQEGLIEELVRRDNKLERRIARITKKLKDKEDSAGQLTKDFHVAEFGCRNGTPVPDYMIPHLKALCERHLQPLRNSGGSVHINSGYRTASYNRAIGGATQSYHIYDLRKRAPAADHVQAGRSAPAVQSWHENHNPFDGMGFYAGFTHGDDRGYRSRWYGAA